MFGNVPEKSSAYERAEKVAFPQLLSHPVTQQVSIALKTLHPVSHRTCGRPTRSNPVPSCLRYTFRIDAKCGDHDTVEFASDIGEMFRIAGRGYDPVCGLDRFLCELAARVAGSSGN